MKLNKLFLLIFASVGFGLLTFPGIFSSTNFHPERFDLGNGQRGCCSHHGGVCGCSSISGHAICCDGASSGCGC